MYKPCSSNLFDQKIFTWSLLLASLAVGCQRGEVLGKVSGRVTFEGQPISKAMILFQDVDRGIYMMAPLDDQGRFEVSMAAGFGLPLGSYDVSLSPPPFDAPPGPIMERPDFIDKFPNIPAKYRLPETSGIRLEVIAGENQLDVDLKQVSENPVP